MATDASVPAQLLAAIKARKFTSGANSVAKLLTPDIHFEAWNNTGHWIADDPGTAARIIEVWYSPGTGPSTVAWSNETSTTKAGTLEVEIHWIAPPDDQPRVLRQVYLMALKDGKISAMRVYCPGLHSEFPEVDLEKQRRQKGLSAAPAKPAAAAPRVTARAG